MGTRGARGLVFALTLLALLASAAKPGRAEEDPELRELKTMFRELLEQNQEQQKQIDRLQKKIEDIEARPAPSPPAERTPAAVVREEVPALSPLDEALAAIGQSAESVQVTQPSAATLQPALFARRFAGADFRLIDIGFDILTAAGGSTASSGDIPRLQGGAHDPVRQGFTLQQGEFSLAAAVDPYFLAEVYTVFGTDFVELEEAFVTTTSLPYNLELKTGYFLTDFGLTNPLHPHAWQWIDQPVINTRMFGGEGQRAVGFDLGWLAPLPWFSEINAGMQNATDLTPSFLAGRPVGGRPAVHTEVNDIADFVYLARWKNSWLFDPEWTGVLGFSGLYGRNSTGSDANTFVYGTDFKIKWVPVTNFRGWPFLMIEGEAVKRDYTADWFIAGTETGGNGGHGHGHDHGQGNSDDDDEDEFPNDLPGDILRDWGFYAQVLYGFYPNWSAGTRIEWASGRGQSVMDGMLVSRQKDPLRGDRLRTSPMIVWWPSHFSRIRLQYNFDHATFLPGSSYAHSVWLSGEFAFGAHPTHRY
jgi:hypothetical protein